MDSVFKVRLLSLEWQCCVLGLNIIPFFFRNNVMEKTKIRSMKNISIAVTVFRQSNTCMAAPDER